MTGGFSGIHSLLLVVLEESFPLPHSLPVRSTHQRRRRSMQAFYSLLWSAWTPSSQRINLTPGMGITSELAPKLPLGVSPEPWVLVPALSLELGDSGRMFEDLDFNFLTRQIKNRKHVTSTVHLNSR
jgi:hypothetical protein